MCDYPDTQVMLVSKRAVASRPIQRSVKLLQHPLFLAAVAHGAEDADGSYLLARPSAVTFDYSFGQCAVSTTSSVDSEVLSRAVDKAIAFLESKGVKESSVWGYSDVYNHMRSASSPGSPFLRLGNMTKKQAWDKNFPLIKLWWDEKHRFCLPIYAGSQKEEMRSREKVEAGKLRLFCSGSLLDYTFAMRLFGNLFYQFSELNLDIGFWPGFSHFYGGWDYLVQKLTQGMGSVAFHTADCTKFDMTQSHDILVSAVLPVFRYFANRKEKERSEVCLFHLVYSLLQHPNGDLVFLDKNNKSGSAFTIHVNMVLQLVIHFYTQIMWEIKEECVAPEVRFCYCGDDNLSVLPKDTAYDPYRYYSDFGLVLKYVRKTQNLSEVEFLSRYFVQYNGNWVARVDVAKHLCSLKFNTPVSRAVYVQKCNSLIEECANSPGVEALVKHRAFALSRRADMVVRYDPEEYKLALSSVRSLDECRRLHAPVLENPIKFRR